MLQHGKHELWLLQEATVGGCNGGGSGCKVGGCNGGDG